MTELETRSFLPRACPRGPMGEERAPQECSMPDEVRIPLTQMGKQRRTAIPRTERADRDRIRQAAFALIERGRKADLEHSDQLILNLSSKPVKA